MCDINIKTRRSSYSSALKNRKKERSDALHIVFQLCRSLFRFIILQEKFRCKSKGTVIEKELFRTQSGIYMKYGGLYVFASQHVYEYMIYILCTYNIFILYAYTYTSL